MGHLGVRKLHKELVTWSEINTKKHKHDFSMHYILEEKSPNGTINYYDILKCNQCNSFKSISKEDNITGHIFDSLSEEQNKLPLLKAKKKHNRILGFYDIEYVYEELNVNEKEI